MTDRRPSRLQALKPVEALAKEEKEAEEGAPKLETPESPEVPSDETPRDEEAFLETPESPARPPETRKAFVERLLADDSVPALLFSGETILSNPQVASLGEDARAALHVSLSPVNSHAPVWLPREPNSP